LDVDAQRIGENRDRVWSRVTAAAARCGRNPEGIRLLAVTKTLPQTTVRSAIESGITLFGENRVQEAAEKYDELADSVELHLIGHLQRNKAKSAARLFDCIESIDRIETARELSKRIVEASRRIEILIEVNTTGEQSKFGLGTDDELWRLFDGVAELEGIDLRGLMTVGPFTDAQDPIRRSFSRLRRLFEESVRRYPELRLDTLSMGMSNDYELAVEEGATLLRIGTALFGPRPS
jgi:pyridoxal phosphate enzyme (YggS family)